jgi:hypothetical protein
MGLGMTTMTKSSIIFKKYVQNDQANGTLSGNED